MRDDAIRAKWVKLVVDESEGGGLGQLESKRAVLERIERRDFWLQQGLCTSDAQVVRQLICGTPAVDQHEMTPEEAQWTRDPKVGQIAICKLISKKEAASQQRERKAAQKERKKAAAEEKELQLTWGVSLNDLSHKLKKASQVLDKGGRLALVISAPKGSKLPSKAEREAFVGSLKQHLGLGTEKVKIWKEDEWRGAKTSAFLAGTPQTRPTQPTTQAETVAAS